MPNDIQGPLLHAGIDISGGKVNIVDTTVNPFHINGKLSAQIESTTTSITNAEIKLLFSVPITLVAAPGVGKALIFHGAMAFLNHGGTDFVADANEDFQIQYDGAVAVSELALQVDFIEAAADVHYWLAPKNTVITANQELEAANITAEVATGDGVMEVTCYYETVTLLT